MSISKLSKCAACFECKSRVFKNEDELKMWCGKTGAHCRSNWIAAIRQHGQVILYWCTQLPNKPKMIFRTCDPAFIKNCTKNVSEVDVITLRKCDVWQIKSTMKGRTIYNGAPKQRKKAIQMAQTLANNSRYQVVVEHYQTRLRIYDNNKSTASGKSR